MKFEDIIEGHKPELIDIIIKLQSMILGFNDKIAEDIYGGKVVKMASYSIVHVNNVIAVTSLAKDHCKLFLHHTDKIDLRDLKFEGKGKHAKHVKLFHIDELVRYEKVIEQVVKIVNEKSGKF